MGPTDLWNMFLIIHTDYNGVINLQLELLDM